MLSKASRSLNMKPRLQHLVEVLWSTWRLFKSWENAPRFQQEVTGTLPETSSKRSEDAWLEDKLFFWDVLFSGSGRVKVWFSRHRTTRKKPTKPVRFWATTWRMLRVFGWSLIVIEIIICKLGGSSSHTWLSSSRTSILVGLSPFPVIVANEGLVWKGL